MPWWVNAGRIATFVVPICLFVGGWIYAIIDKIRYIKPYYSQAFENMTIITIIISVAGFVAWIIASWGWMM